MSKVESVSGERRRSDRLLLTIPLRAEGIDAEGAPFKEDARTTPFSLNRHGAHIRTAHALAVGQVLRLVNLITSREADFRVVGPVSPLTEEGGAYGVFGPISSNGLKSLGYGLECLDTEEHFWEFWQIRFPGPSEDATSGSMLECRECHTGSLLRLSVIDFDVLRTAGILSWPCETCGATTPWGYQADVPADALKFRRGRRVCAQLPLRIRRYSGEVEITRSENISKCGLRFISEKRYYPGEGIVAACPYHGKGGDNIELEGHIVYEKPIEGTNRKIYGVRYSYQARR